MKSHTHADLVRIAYRWLTGPIGCSFAFRELVTIGWETPDVIGFRGGVSILVECKCSRADFLADKKKPFRLHPSLGMGRYRFFCCPTGLIKADELPDNWGLVYVNEKGKASLVYNPYHAIAGANPGYWQNPFEFNQRSETDLLCSALRRLQAQGLLESIYSTPLLEPTDEAPAP